MIHLRVRSEISIFSSKKLCIKHIPFLTTVTIVLFVVKYISQIVDLRLQSAVLFLCSVKLSTLFWEFLVHMFETREYYSAIQKTTNIQKTITFIHVRRFYLVLFQQLNS